MLMKRLAALALAGAMMLGHASAQTSPGTSPLTIPKGGTGAATASAARSNLGLAIGSNVQAWDADLDALAALAGTSTIYYRSASATWSAVTIGALLQFSGGTLNVGDPELVALAGLTSANNKCFYWTGSGTAATYDCSSFGRGLINATDASAGRTALGLIIGTDVQAYDPELAALAGLTSANNKCFYWTGSGTAATYDCSTYGRGLSNAADASAARTALGLVIGTDVQAYDSDLGALASNSSNGLWARTGAGTGAVRTLTAPAAGITISNGDGVSGNPTLVLADDLAALEALSTTGICRRTGTSAWACGTAVANSELATMATDTFKGNVSGSTAAPSDLTATQVTAALNTMVGDSGSGGTKGLVPAPGAGDAAAAKFLKADGTWAVPAGGGGGGGMTDTERQNAALDRIYAAKTSGGYRRVINQFVDGFAATDGVNTGSSTNYSVDTTNKRVAPTSAGGSDATGGGTALSGGDQSGFGPSRAFDNNNATDWESSQTGPSGQNGVAYVGYDFGSGVTKNITTATIKQGGASLSVSSVLVQYSDNGSAWTTASTWSGLPADTTVQSNTFSSAGSHRYWRLLANANVSGSGNAWVVYEVEFIEPGTTNNMTLVTTAQTADATVSNGRVLIEYNPIDAITLNTHLTAEVTCNGGMNWASATLSNAGTGQAGRAVAETADTACTSGTSFAARIKSLNNKNLQIYGTSLTVH